MPEDRDPRDVNVFSLASLRNLEPGDDPRPLKVIADEIIQTYGSDPEINRELEELRDELDRFKTIEDIEPFLRRRSLIDKTPWVYLGLALKLVRLLAAQKREE